MRRRARPAISVGTVGVTGQRLVDLVHPEDLALSESELKRHFAGEVEYYDLQARMRHKNGHWVWVHDRGRVVTWTESGEPSMMYGTHADITEQKQVRGRLWLEQEKRKNVVINTCHLLHTPITVVKGNLELVRREIRELSPDLIDRLIERLEDMKVLINGGLYEKIGQMAVETSDGFTPVKKAGSD